jgi:hypothetical protein
MEFPLMNLEQKVFLWCLVKPNFSIASVCALDPYPALLSHKYSGCSLESSFIRLSLVTLAIMEAAEIDCTLLSPLIIHSKGIPLCPGNLSPSTRRFDGSMFRLSIAFFIETKVACNMLILSISSGSEDPIP